MKFLRYFKAKDWIFILVMTGCIFLQVYLELQIPGYMSEMTSVINSGSGDSTINSILIIGAKMLGFTLLSSLIAILVGYISAIVSAKVARRMREDVYNAVQTFSLNEINKFSIPSLITRSTNDITQIQTSLNMCLRMVRAPIMAIWALAIITSKSWQWSVATAVAVGVMMLMVVILVSVAIPKFKKIQALTDDLNSVTRENLTGLRVVRANNAEDYQKNKFEKANTNVTKTHLFVSKIMALMGPVMTLMATGLSLAIYWIGAYIINGAQPSEKIALFGDMVVFMSYAMMLLMSFMAFTIVFIMLPRAIVSYKRIKEVLNTQPSIKDGSGNFTTTQRGTIEFKDVSFKYDNATEYVLKNISFKAECGQTVAFIGSTGSGKSTLINLIPRFYDATSGQVLIDSVDVKEYKKQDLIDKIGYISQKAVLFSGSIKSNITFGSNKQYDEQKVKEALNIAQAQDFVQSKKEGVDALIAQGGKNISGGQKQRLSIARALYKDPEILIFDDSFSALDYATDKLLRDALKDKVANKTNVIVAQRISTIKNADKIIVLNDGEIVGEGTHKELMQTCKVYQEIAYSQLSKEELDKWAVQVEKCQILQKTKM